ncbi:hypothetical protein MYCTH_2069363, partial [Thermothelomyces thermophilus ATCC 42464]
KMAFRTPYSYYEYLIMLFRLTNALATLFNEFYIVCLDNILIFLPNYKTYIKYI